MAHQNNLPSPFLLGVSNLELSALRQAQSQRDCRQSKDPNNRAAGHLPRSFQEALLGLAPKRNAGRFQMLGGHLVLAARKKAKPASRDTTMITAATRMFIKSVAVRTPTAATVPMAAAGPLQAAPRPTSITPPTTISRQNPANTGEPPGTSSRQNSHNRAL